MTSRFRACFLLFACFGAATVSAAEFGGSVTAGVSYTDNVLLFPSPGEVDDWIYRLSPEITFLHESPTLDANLRYRYEWYQYTELDTTSSYHMGEASVTGKTWQESLALELGALRSQVLRDPGFSIPGGRLPASGNLVDLDEIYANPRLERELGRAVSVIADYRYSENRYDDESIQNDTNQSARFVFDNYRNGQGLTWALRYDWRRTEYEASPPWEYQQAGAELGFWFNTTTRLFASGGRESPWDDPFTPGLKDPFWEAGIAHTLGEDKTAEFAVGERSFGDSWRGRLDWQFRRGNTSVSYAETPTTTGFRSSGGRRNALDPDDLDDFLNVPGSAERYLSKRLQWNLDLDFRRTSLALVLFDEDRSGRIDTDGTPLSDQTQQGAILEFTWQAGARTEFRARGTIISRDDGEDAEADFYGAGLSATYRLGSRTELVLSYEYTEEQPEGENSSVTDYVANVASLLFTYNF